MTRRSIPRTTEGIFIIFLTAVPSDPNADTEGIFIIFLTAVPSDPNADTEVYCFSVSLNAEPRTQKTPLRRAGLCLYI